MTSLLCRRSCILPYSLLFRAFSSTVATSSFSSRPAAPLHFTRVQLGPTNVVTTATASSWRPVIFLHCFLGAIDSWSVFLRTLQAEFNDKAAHATCLDAYLVDSRDHGQSPHSPPRGPSSSNALEDMVADLLLFIEQHNIEKPLLIGHSLGGKVAMLFALRHASKISNLIILDAAPSAYGHSHEELIKSMLQLDLSVVTSRHQASALLSDINPSLDAATRAFALMNLVRVPDDHTNALVWRFRCNLPELLHRDACVRSWPLAPPVSSPTENAGDGCTPFPRRALFIGGKQSSRLTTHVYTVHIPTYFPHHEVQMFEGGHFVHMGPNAREVAAKVRAFCEY